MVTLENGKLASSRFQERKIPIFEYSKMVTSSSHFREPKIPSSPPKNEVPIFEYLKIWDLFFEILKIPSKQYQKYFPEGNNVFLVLSQHDPTLRPIGSSLEFFEVNVPIFGSLLYN